jgi:ribosomal protein L44E
MHNMDTLYDVDFDFAVTKFGDNGRVHTIREVEAYLKEYRRRVGARDRYYERMYAELLGRTSKIVTSKVSKQSRLYRVAQWVHREIS